MRDNPWIKEDGELISAKPTIRGKRRHTVKLTEPDCDNDFRLEVYEQYLSPSDLHQLGLWFQECAELADPSLVREKEVSEVSGIRHRLSRLEGKAA